MDDHDPLVPVGSRPGIRSISERSPRWLGPLILTMVVGLSVACSPSPVKSHGGQASSYPVATRAVVDRNYDSGWLVRDEGVSVTRIRVGAEVQSWKNRVRIGEAFFDRFEVVGETGDVLASFSLCQPYEICSGGDVGLDAGECTVDNNGDLNCLIVRTDGHRFQAHVSADNELNTAEAMSAAQIVGG